CEYNSDFTTIYRRTVTEYNLDSAYVSKRILGLPKTVCLYEGSGTTLASKVGYFYDGKDGANTICTNCLSALPNNAAAAQHDGAAYGAGMNVERGNLTNTRRYDVTAPSTYVETKTGYNITGSVVFACDALGRQTNIEYADSYYNNTTMMPALTPATFAYPTKVIDPEGYFSTASYEYYWGVVKKQTNPKSATTRSDYDPATGLLLCVTNEVNSAATTYEYDSNKTWVRTYTNVNDTVMANRLTTTNALDGFDRVRATITEHPGSAGMYKTKMVSFNARGLVDRDYEWAETNLSWALAGDDLASGYGFIYTEYKYDWNARTTQLKYRDGKTKDFSYEGCGCAGGETVTIKDEGATNGGVFKRRTRKVSQDTFGRVIKEQIFNWETTQVLRTSINAFNVRSQLVSTKDYVTGTIPTDGSCPSGSCQFTELKYDGHARLSERWLPIYKGTTQDPSPTPCDKYEYNDDDTLKKLTDPRQISANYLYNQRKLPLSITYGGISAEKSVHFLYDELGNRTQMKEKTATDQLWGQVDYLYDTLGRMQYEKRQFFAQGFPQGFFKLNYDYNLSGKLKSLGYESSLFPSENFSLAYGFDKAGQLISMTGAGVGGVNTFLPSTSPVKYRAWGAAKQINYSNGRMEKFDYNNRLQVKSYEIPSSYNFTYTYHEDGKLKTANSYENHAFEYDAEGRLVKAIAGDENPNPNFPASYGRYRQHFNYDAWGNLYFRVSAYNYSEYQTSPLATYLNGRNTNSTWRHNEAGQLYKTPDTEFTLNAQGQPTYQKEIESTSTQQLFIEYDGNGLQVKRTRNSAASCFYIRSSILGGSILAEVNVAGNKQVAYIYAQGRMIVKHKISNNDHSWLNYDPANILEITVKNNGNTSSITHDPLGNPTDALPTVPTGDFYNGDLPTDTTAIRLVRCKVDGAYTNCNEALDTLNQGLGAIAPENNVYPIVRHGKKTVAIWRAFGDGFQGYVPIGESYLGGGVLGGKSRGSGFGARSYRSDTNLAAINGGVGEADLGYAGQGGGQPAGVAQQTSGGTGVATPTRPCGPTAITSSDAFT
ncbi:MAG: hypothetical protein HOP19_18825, partial [Acidobacteria bacterium]|nr:hypothetical protein [Acidobacteriota bacterium]